MFLVTGGSGFIGSHLVEHLVSQGCVVRCLVRRSSELRHLRGSAIELAYGDLTTGEGLAEAARGVEIVFHLAGVTKAKSTEQYYVGNAGATANLVRVCSGIQRFVHVSSLAAAGPSADGAPVAEDADTQPVSHYGRSKLESEQIVRNSSLARRSVIVRPPVVYGPRDTGLCPMFRAVSRGLWLQIGREERFFSVVYVKDLVEGLWAAARSPTAGGKTYFLAHSEPVSWSEFGALAAKLMGRRARSVSVPPRLAYAVGLAAEGWSRLSRKPGILSRDKIAEACCRYWICDTSRAQREIGFSARTTLAGGMAETLAWYKEAGWLKY